MLNTTKHERNNLLVENHALKKTNTELRRQVIEAEQDTQQAKVELEMIEDMVASIDNLKGKLTRTTLTKYLLEKRESIPNLASRTSQINEILPREAPSANTALNILTSHHDEQMANLQTELSQGI